MVSLSIVAAGRDPHHAGDLMGRVRRAYKRNFELAKDFDVDWVFVEWNPTDELISPWLAQQGVRCFVVPKMLHNEYVEPTLRDRYTFMDGFANNVGARRALHEWVLITNNDTIIGPEVWAFLKGNELNPTVMYRAERRDIPWRHFGKVFATMERHRLKVYSIHTKPCHAAGSFMLVSMQNYPGYDERIRDTNRHIDGHLCWNWFQMGYTTQVIGKVYKADHRLLLHKQRKDHFIPEKGRKRSQSGLIRKSRYDNTPDWGLPQYADVEVVKNMCVVGG